MTTGNETYLIRQKVFKILGEAFHIYGRDGNVVGYCKQKAFRFREKIIFYTGPDRSEELFTVNARNIIDFGATYDVALPGGGALGSLRRKGFSSWLMRDAWTINDAAGAEIASILEDSTSAALMRRFVPLAAVFSPQVLHVRTSAGEEIATFRKRFNPFIHKMGVEIHAEHEQLDDLVILAAACTFMAIDAKQRRQNG